MSITSLITKAAGVVAQDYPEGIPEDHVESAKARMNGLIKQWDPKLYEFNLGWKERK